MVVPEKGWDYVVGELHGGHPGATRMKALARGLVWWPGVDGMVEGVVKNCQECQDAQPLPPTQPMQPWSWPTRTLCWSFGWTYVFSGGGRALQVARCHSDEDSVCTNNYWETADLVCELRDSGVYRLGQWSTACRSRVSGFL